MNRKVFCSAVFAALAMPALPRAAHAGDPKPVSAARLAAFGAAVVVVGDVAYIGEPAAGKTGGVVHLYRRTPTGGWREFETIKSPAGKAGDGFGGSIAADARTLLVGMAGDSARGAVAAFRRNAAGAWVSAGYVVSPKVMAKARFGTTIALAGDDVAIGAPGEGSGAVHVFHRGTDGQWQEQSQLTLPGKSMPTDGFGGGLAISGDWLAIGAPGRDSAAGAIFAFHRGGDGKWNEGQLLTLKVNLPKARLGTRLLMNGDELYVGAPAADANNGRVITFKRDTAAGTFVEKSSFAPFESGVNHFGYSMAMAGEELWVGAPLAMKQTGAVYRIHRDGGRWSGMTLLKVDSVRRGALMGLSLAASATAAVVGLPNDGDGSVAFATRTAGNWTARGHAFVPTKEFAAVTGAEVRCHDGKARDFTCGNTGLLAFLPISQIGGKRGTNLNDNWGWTDPETNHEYALVGRTDGTSFVDITDPGHPRYLGDLPMTAGSNSSAWRDIKTYKNHAFIVSDNAGEHGMQVFDLTRLRAVKAAQTFEPDYVYHKINSAHNLVINEESGFAYAVGSSGGGETCGGGLHMIDIRDMKHPVFAGCFQDKSTGTQKTGYSHDAQCVMYKGPDTRYSGHEICIGSNETAISIADVTDKQHPVAISHASYPDVGYTHQGWLTDDQKYFYLDDELDEMGAAGDTTGTKLAGKGTRTLVWDVSKLDDPVLAYQYVGMTKSIDHNLYIKGNRIYESNYASGLRILDISDPRKPHEVGFFDTYPDDDDVHFVGSWSNYPYFKSGTILVTSIGEGMFLIKDRTNVVP